MEPRFDQLPRWQRLLAPAFRWWWRDYLEVKRLVKITGWNACLYDEPWGQRVHASFEGRES